MRRFIIVGLLATNMVVSLAVCFYLMLAGNPFKKEEGLSSVILRLDERLNRLEEAFAQLQSTLVKRETDQQPLSARADPPLMPGEIPEHEQADRLASIESDIVEIKDILKSFAPDVTLGTTDELSLADVQFEKQRMGTAAMLYVSFLEHHPDDPDAPALWRKASLAYEFAGRPSKAIWAQEESMRRHPQLANFEAVLRLAQLKGHQKPGEAIGLVESALGVAPSAEQKAEAVFWRARFINDSQGPEAGIAAFEEAERDIRAMGVESQAANCRKWVEGIISKIERDQKAGVRK